MADHAQMTEIIRPYATVSDRIRALDAAGFKRAEIATFLGKRYQHVRNVLVDSRPGFATPPLRATPSAQGFAQAPTPAWREGAAVGALANDQDILRLEINPDGSVLLPLPVRQALGYVTGGVAIARLKDGNLELLSTSTALRRARELLQVLRPEAESLSHSLIADRRREAAGGA